MQALLSDKPTMRTLGDVYLAAVNHEGGFLAEFEKYLAEVVGDAWNRGYETGRKERIDVK